MKLNILAIDGTTSAEGIVVVGVNSDTGESFQEVLHLSSIEKDLDLGPWEFYLFTWGGGTPMSGEIFCSPFISKNFNSSSDVVDLL